MLQFLFSRNATICTVLHSLRDNFVDLRTLIVFYVLLIKSRIFLCFDYHNIVELLELI